MILWFEYDNLMTENELSEYKRHPVVFLQHKKKGGAPLDKWRCYWVDLGKENGLLGAGHE